MTPSTLVTELTVEELIIIIQQAVKNAMSAPKTEPIPDEQPRDQWGILDIPPLSIDPRHPALHILSREEMYDDDGR